MELRNDTPLKFSKLDDNWREYDYAAPDGKIVTITIENPRFLNVNPIHGAHRIVDECGVVHYMPGNFLALRWCVKDGTPHFHTTVHQPDGTVQQITFGEADEAV